MKKNFIFYILKYTWSIRILDDQTWVFNFYNPLAWLLLLLWAVRVGLQEFFGAALEVIVDTLKESKKPRK